MIWNITIGGLQDRLRLLQKLLRQELYAIQSFNTFTANVDNTRQGPKILQKHRTDMAVNVFKRVNSHLTRPFIPPISLMATSGIKHDKIQLLLQ